MEKDCDQKRKHWAEPKEKSPKKSQEAPWDDCSKESLLEKLKSCDSCDVNVCIQVDVKDYIDMELDVDLHVKGITMMLDDVMEFH
jgi:hypothetical protein